MLISVYELILNVFLRIIYAEIKLRTKEALNMQDIGACTSMR